MPGSRQHTVQKKLLSNFTSTPHSAYRNQKIWTHVILENKNHESGLKNVSVNKNFLSDIADNKITQLEQETYPIISRIQENKMIFTDTFTERERVENCFFLYRYVAMQLFRTPKFRENLSKILGEDSNLKDFLKIIQSSNFTQLGISKNFIDFGFGRVFQDLKGNRARNYFNDISKLSSIPILQFDSMAASLFDVTLPVVVTNKTQIPYIQNDLGLCPFFPIGTTKNNLKYTTTDGPELDIICVFPIDPSIIICFCTLISLKKWTDTFPLDSNRGLLLESGLESDVRLTNKYLYEYAQKYIYSNMKFDFSMV